MAARRITTTLISKNIIKPSSPTPSALRSHKFSLVDQFPFNIYIPTALFYSKPNTASQAHIFENLQDSLSKTLMHYYPFAGRVRDHVYVDCNDAGAELNEARLDCSMSEILNRSDRDLVFPEGLTWRPVHPLGSLLVAQLSRFNCGGLALSTCISHKVGDGFAVCNFIRNWASIARLHGKNQTNPHFSSPHLRFDFGSILPPSDDPNQMPATWVSPSLTYATKRLIFPSSKLGALKATICKDLKSNITPTRVEAVSSLLYKCAAKAANWSRPSMLSLHANLRFANAQIFAREVVGNLISTFSAVSHAGAKIELSRVIRDLKTDKEKLLAKCKDILQPKEAFSSMFGQAREGRRRLGLSEDDPLDIYLISSVCNFPFQEADFGWGRPERVSFGSPPVENFFVLTDNQSTDNGGIEAMVNLDEKVMASFETDEELLEFTIPLP